MDDTINVDIEDLCLPRLRVVPERPLPLHKSWEEEALFLRRSLAKALNMIEYLNAEVGRLARKDPSSEFDGSVIGEDCSELFDNLV